jgi:hypothetical protein
LLPVLDPEGPNHWVAIRKSPRRVPEEAAFASDRNSADRFNGTAALKISPQNRLKFRYFPMASGRDEVDEL